MARTTATAVKAILLKDYDTVAQPSLTPFMEMAQVMMTRMIACASRKGITQDSTELEMIERLLAAHCYCINDRQYMSRNTLSGGGSFAGQFGMGLDMTSYGQQAKVLDSSGCLANFDKQQTAVGFWLGKPPSEQIAYEDRD